MSYLPRLLSRSLPGIRRDFPVLVLTGPRQSGKTTLLRRSVPEATYVSFDDPLQREVARRDPRSILQGAEAGPLLLDEIQYVPELLPYVKIAVDADRDRRGAFLLTGSQSFSLMAGVSESLAGRAALVELYPFSILELEQAGPRSLASFVFAGGYPGPALHPSTVALWVSSYIATYVERDVRQVRDIQDLRLFETFLGLLAARHGQELSLASVSRDVGVSLPTARAWVSVLAASYLVYLLPPWHSNLGKRLVKSPKLYFVDPALVCALTRIPTPEAALAGPLGGALLEGVVVTESLKLFAAAGRRPALWFWRSNDGLEVDLLVEVGGEVVPVEVKLTATPTPRHADALGRFRKLLPAASAGRVVCGVEERVSLGGGVVAMPWQSWSADLAARLGLLAEP